MIKKFEEYINEIHYNSLEKIRSTVYDRIHHGNDVNKEFDTYLGEPEKTMKMGLYYVLLNYTGKMLKRISITNLEEVLTNPIYDFNFEDALNDFENFASDRISFIDWVKDNKLPDALFETSFAVEYNFLYFVDDFIEYAKRFVALYKEKKGVDNIKFYELSSYFYKNIKFLDKIDFSMKKAAKDFIKEKCGIDFNLLSNKTDKLLYKIKNEYVGKGVDGFNLMYNNYVSANGYTNFTIEISNEHRKDIFVLELQGRFGWKERDGVEKNHIWCNFGFRGRTTGGFGIVEADIKDDGRMVYRKGTEDKRYTGDNDAFFKIFDGFANSYIKKGFKYIMEEIFKIFSDCGVNNKFDYTEMCENVEKLK